jgi:hypothetical protein
VRLLDACSGIADELHRAFALQRLRVELPGAPDLLDAPPLPR